MCEECEERTGTPAEEHAKDHACLLAGSATVATAKAIAANGGATPAPSEQTAREASEDGRHAAAALAHERTANEWNRTSLVADAVRAVAHRRAAIAHRAVIAEDVINCDTCMCDVGDADIVADKHDNVVCPVCRDLNNAE